jgi:hypothetical protein
MSKASESPEKRQLYPESKGSGVDEWKAIIKQQATLHESQEKEKQG